MTDKTYVEVTLGRDFATVTNALKTETVTGLARLVGTTPEQIELVALWPGSWHALLRMLPPLANRLIDMYESQNPEVHKLGIERVRLIEMTPPVVTEPGPPLLLTDLLARVVTYNRFSGWAGRRIDVPPGHVGLVIRRGLVAGRLEPGRQVVLGWTDLLFDRVAAMEVALIRTEPVVAPLLLPHLLTADEKLVGLWAQVEMQVVEPEAFYHSFLQNAWELTAPAVLNDLLAARNRPGLEQAVRSLSTRSNLPTELNRSLLPILAGVGRAGGLELKPIRHSALWPVDEALLRLEKVHEMAIALRQVEIDAAVDSMEQVAVMRDVVHQMAQDYELPPEMLVGVYDGVVQAGLSAREALLVYLEAVQALGQTGLSQRMFHLQHRLQPREAGREIPPPSPPRPWWATWSGLLRWSTYLVYLVFVIIAILGSGQSVQDKLFSLVEILAALPVAVGMLLLTLQMDKKAARERARWHKQHGLAALREGDLQQTDGLVRQQVAAELAHVAQVVQESRQRLYRAGREEAALRLGEVTHQAERLAQQVRQPAQGTPVYLDHSIESWERLEQCLNYDEQLLGLAAATDQVAHELRQAALNGEVELPRHVKSLEIHLAELEQTFSARSRIG